MGFHFTIYGGMVPGTALDRAFFRVAQVGWVGVDLFFVLSGFLITGILFDAKGGDSYFRNFYARRVLRIFPLYYGFLAFVFLVAPLFFSGEPRFERLGDQQLWYWSYLSNVLFAGRGWPDSSVSGYLLGHLWSLAVEEQFYLIWPLLVFALRRRPLQAVCVGAVVASLAFRLWLLAADRTTAAYVLTPARMDALAAGAFLALAARGPRGLTPLVRWAGPSALACAALLVGIIAWRGRLAPEDLPVQIIGYPLIAGFFSALLILGTKPPSSSWWGSVFTNPALRFFGRYSYALYVFHHPLIGFLRSVNVSADVLPRFLGSQLPGQMLVIAVATAGSVALALASWHLYEAPFLRLKQLFPYHVAAAALPRAVETPASLQRATR
jgi:peptidoglycan/LPS O-acetylase OafA/YrhL